MRNPYESLAVPRKATADDIKKSFRQLAKKLHPDIDKNDPRAAARFAELNAAHKILGDKKKRRAFDRGKIDAQGRPTRSYGKWQVATRLMIGVLMFATGSTLIIHRLTPPSEVTATSDDEQVRSVQTERPERAAQPSNSDASASRVLATSAPTDHGAIFPPAGSRLDREQTELLIARGRKLMSEGDVEAARALLERAAASRDPRAALDLGSTYDPIMLAILQVRGVAADAFLARIWYRRALEYGSEEARERLELLAYADAHGEKPIVVAPREIPRSVERRTAATAATAAIAPATPKSRIRRPTNEIRTSRQEVDQPCSVRCLLDAAPPWLN